MRYLRFYDFLVGFCSYCLALHRPESHALLDCHCYLVSHTLPSSEGPQLFYHRKSCAF